MSTLIVGGAGYVSSQTAKRVAQAEVMPAFFGDFVVDRSAWTELGLAERSPSREGDGDPPMQKRSER